MSDEPSSLLQPKEHVLSTLEADGSRRWLHPRLSKGKHWHRRRAVAWLLIGIFTAIPWLRWDGQPLVLLDIINRKFILFGQTFLPTDTLPLALLILSLFLTVFFLTAVLGRVWCGWGCPQTVYMEFVFRPIERIFFGRAGTGGKPAKGVAIWRYVGMYLVYLVLCAHLTNTFLAYFVGTDNLTRWMWTTGPATHPIAFLVFVGATAFLMFDFAFWREQFCIIGCPYGRFQSVMLDRQSLIISYDKNRGEPRGKPRKRKGDAAVSLPVIGDCIDCDSCVQVCPTGIDIRDGLQMECVACTQCIDACDDIMDRMKRPRGLIRYSSQDGIEGKPTKIIRPRVLLYPIAIGALLAGIVVFLATQSTADIEVLRTLGRPFSMTADGRVDNTLRIKITNRTDDVRTYRFAMPGVDGIELNGSGQAITLEPGETLTEPLRLLLPYEAFTGGRLTAELNILDDDVLNYTQRIQLQGPTAPPKPVPLAEPETDLEN